MIYLRIDKHTDRMILACMLDMIYMYIYYV